MIFEQIATGGCQSYLIGCADTCAGALIDPETSQIDRYLGLAARDGLRIRFVIDTHTHADHFSAARRREVIGVGVGVDDEADAQAVARRQAEVAVDLARFGIDQRAGTGVGAADEVRLASAGGDLLEDHGAIPFS